MLILNHKSAYNNNILFLILYLYYSNLILMLTINSKRLTIL